LEIASLKKTLNDNLKKKVNKENQVVPLEEKKHIENILSIRKMIFGYAEATTISLQDQIKINQCLIDNINYYEKKQKRKINKSYIQNQVYGLNQLNNSMDYFEKKNISQNDIDDPLHPNIIIDCFSNGELKCKDQNIKVYQTVFGASYGKNKFKDVYLEHNKIKISPASGGKCNVSIGNPYRAIGWFYNYLQQGAQDPIIRCWEIPHKLFLDLVRTSGTEYQIKMYKELRPQNAIKSKEKLIVLSKN
jgi:hypothetical protein